MDSARVIELLERVARGDVLPAAAARILSGAPVEMQGATIAQLDIDRTARTGVPEVIFGESKSAEQIAALLEALYDQAGAALATRVQPEKAAVILAQLPAAMYDASAQTIAIGRLSSLGTVAIVAAGTSDLRVADEAASTAMFLGMKVVRFHDVGVAGVHRLLARIDEIRGADIVIALAGMEGALPTALAGLVRAPVIAVPTSVGYGVGLGGLIALASMLTTCAPGISVVNIDNGFGAAICAYKCLRMASTRGQAQ